MITVYFSAKEATWTAEFPAPPSVGDFIDYFPPAGPATSGQWIVRAVKWYMQCVPGTATLRASIPTVYVELVKQKSRRANAH